MKDGRSGKRTQTSIPASGREVVGQMSVMNECIASSREELLTPQAFWGKVIRVEGLVPHAEKGRARKRGQGGLTKTSGMMSEMNEPIRSKSQQKCNAFS